jgi:hypothetical protein
MPAEGSEIQDSILFDQYNGEIDVEIDLDQAYEERHHTVHIGGDKGEKVEAFIENAADPKWRQQVHENYEEEIGGNPVEFRSEVNWGMFTNQLNDLRTRLVDSGVYGLWVKYEIAELGGVTSSNNDLRAAGLQGIEDRYGSDSFFWDYLVEAQVGHHGLVSAVENPTRSEEERTDQEVYVLETDPFNEQQVASVGESNYLGDDKSGVGEEFEHPAEEDTEENETTLYTRTALGHLEQAYDHLNVSDSMVDSFVEFFKNPESEPAYDLIDPMTATAYIADHNDGQVSLEEGEIRYEA